VPLAAIALGMNDPQPRGAFEPVEDLARSVAGPVVDDDDFELGREIDREQPIDDRGDGRLFVEDGNDYGDERTAGGVLRGQKGSIGAVGILRQSGIGRRWCGLRSGRGCPVTPDAASPADGA
jgi:hypothetical protein